MTITTRERGVIPGCIAAAPDGHMAVDVKTGIPWIYAGPSDVDTWLARIWSDIRAFRIMRGVDPETGLLLAA